MLFSVVVLPLKYNFRLPNKDNAFYRSSGKDENFDSLFRYKFCRRENAHVSRDFTLKALAKVTIHHYVLFNN